MIRYWIWILIASFILFGAGAVNAETGFLNRSVTVKGVTYRYVVYVPQDWNAAKKWPVILFLHGSIEKGDDGVQQSKVCIGRIAQTDPKRFPAIIVMPQCRMDASWETGRMQEQALAALDASSQEFNGDLERTYLTGFSMGGYGTWSLAGRHPERFAALIVVSGGIVWPPSEAVREPDPKANPYVAAARKVAHIPVWVFHGDADQNVPFSESRRMVDALKALNADIRFTEYKGLAHFICDKAYDDRDLPAWLFAQRLKTAPAP
jgi:predicted peptidase